MRQDEHTRPAIRHLSGPTYCVRRTAPAIISAVERAEGGRCLRSIVWCSLRGRAQWCGEDCLSPPRATNCP